MNTTDHAKAEADLAEWGERTNQIAGDLMKANPSLNFITATIVAGDLLSAERATNEVKSGTTPAEKAVWLVGSYARWDWAITMMNLKQLDEGWFFDNILDLWRGSDPDDTNHAYLDLFRRAKTRKGSYLRDGRPLPRARDRQITVYRGGPPSMALYRGFAWTTDPKIAQKFAGGAGERVMRSDGVVITGHVFPGQVLAYITERGEAEVVVDPQFVRDVKPVGA